ncbi:MAG: DUF6089 family protein [Bacteroidetes bacterium]|nr:DUF6089 family protein [Bacteroidota bacterium]
MKKIIIIICGILISLGSYAQRSELGGFAGTSYYLGDLNPSNQFGSPNLAAGLIYRYNLNPHWAFRVNAIYGILEGDDADYSNPRNLSFRTNVFEFSTQIELNFFEYFTGSKAHRFTPYIFGGVGVFFFNPQAKDIDGKWQDLQPLGTEGQGTISYPTRKPYSLTQMAVPFGVGLKLSISKTICIGLEWGMRKTFTDYIDDVSTTYVDNIVLAAEKGKIAAFLADKTTVLINPQTGYAYPAHLENTQRGNSENNDWYSFAGFTITFKLGAKTKPSCFDKGFNYKENIYY